MIDVYSEIAWPVQAKERYDYYDKERHQYSFSASTWNEQSFLTRVTSIEFIFKQDQKNILVMYTVTDATGQDFYLEVDNGNITVYRSFPNKWLLMLLTIDAAAND